MDNTSMIMGWKHHAPHITSNCVTKSLSLLSQDGIISQVIVERILFILKRRQSMVRHFHFAPHLSLSPSLSLSLCALTSKFHQPKLFSPLCKQQFIFDISDDLIKFDAGTTDRTGEHTTWNTTRNDCATWWGESNVYTFLRYENEWHISL